MYDHDTHFERFKELVLEATENSHDIPNFETRIEFGFSRAGLGAASEQ